MAEEKNITRKVVESRTFNMFSMEGASLKFLESVVVAKGEKLSDKEKATAEKHKAKKIISVLESTTKAIYGVPVEKFMEIAEKLEEKIVKADDESAEENKEENK